MYAISKVSKESQDFISKVKCDNFCAIGLAKAIIASKPVPVSETDDIEMYFIDNHSLAVKDTISKVNELLVVDTAFVLEAARTLWKARAYAAVPCTDLPVVFPGMNKAIDVYGFGSCVSQDLDAMIHENPHEIMKAYLGFSRLIKEIETTES